MDALSITASAIALGSLVQATLVSLNSLIRDYKAFSQELATLGAEIQSLSLVINSLEKYVEGRLTLRAPLDDPHLLSALNACRPTLKAIKSKCKEIRRQLGGGRRTKTARSGRTTENRTRNGRRAPRKQQLLGKPGPKRGRKRKKRISIWGSR